MIGGIVLALALILILGILFSQLLRSMLAAVILTLVVALLIVLFGGFLIHSDLEEVKQGSTLFLLDFGGSYTHGMTMSGFTVDSKSYLNGNPLTPSQLGVMNDYVIDYDAMLGTTHTQLFLVEEVEVRGNESLGDILQREVEADPLFFAQALKDETLTPHPSRITFQLIKIAPSWLLEITLFQEEKK